MKKRDMRIKFEDGVYTIFYGHRVVITNGEKRFKDVVKPIMK